MMEGNIPAIRVDQFKNDIKEGSIYTLESFMATQAQPLSVLQTRARCNSTYHSLTNSACLLRCREIVLPNHISNPLLDKHSHSGGICYTGNLYHSTHQTDLYFYYIHAHEINGHLLQI
jgi:hypothetical protein